MPSELQSPRTDPLGDPALRRSLEDFVRRRVPSSDVDDVVQTVLCDALAAAGRPAEPTELRRWLLGIARHKVVDLHRRAHREPPAELPEVEVGPPPLEERGLARWAEQQAGSTHDAQKTLAWMAREGEGEKLEAIAAEEQLPPARVRQRVSRMRRWMKERWTAELAAVAMLALLAVGAWWLLRTREEPPVTKNPDAPPAIAPEPPSPLDRARSLRADALQACERNEWRPCLDGLDQARALDPEGEQAPAVGAARARAEDGLRSATPPDTAAPLATAVPTAPSSKDAEPSNKDPDGKSSLPRLLKGTPSSLPDAKPSSGTTSSGKKPSRPKPAVKQVLDSDGYGKKK